MAVGTAFIAAPFITYVGKARHSACCAPTPATSSSNATDGAQVAVATAMTTMSAATQPATQVPSPQIGDGDGAPPAPPGGNGDGDGKGGSGGGGSEGDGEGDGTSPLAAYLRVLRTHPLPTKIATAGFITTISDYIAQSLENGSGNPRKLNRRRLLSFFCVGALLTAPLFHAFYELLEATLPVAAGPRNIALQLLADMGLAAPVWAVLFSMVVTTVEKFGHDDLRSQIVAAVRGNTWPILKVTYAVFLPVQTVSFALLPAMFRVLVITGGDLIVTTVVSLIAHLEQAGVATVK